METNNKNIDTEIVDTLIAIPQAFKVRGQRFLIYPVTLGKVYLISRQLQLLGINLDVLRINTSLEMLRIVREHRAIVCRVIAYLTCKDVAEVADDDLVEERVGVFMTQLDDSEIASLLMYYLQSDKTEQIINNTEMKVDLDRKKQVGKVKTEGNKNSFSFGGVTAIGSLVDWAAERYGWTKEYIVWGIDYATLKLLQLDAPSTIYVTDDERKRIHFSNDRNVINGDSKSAMDEFINSQNWD